MVKTALIESARHPLISQWCALRDRQKHCPQDQVFIEGSLLIQELAPLITPIALLASCPKLLEQMKLLFRDSSSLKSYLLSERAMKRVSAVVSPEGLCLICCAPKMGQLDPHQRWLICDQIGDPGNLGTLIRTACAFCWDGVYLLGNCCDPLNAKALRAGRGSAFKIPLARGTIGDIASCQIAKSQLLIATAAGKTELSKKEIPTRWGLWLAVGNESRGVCPELTALGESIAIKARGMESLNVACAGAIFMHTLAKESKEND